MTRTVDGKSALRRRFAAGFRDPVVRANMLALAGGKIIGLTDAVYENNAMQAGNIVNAVRAFDVNHARHGRQ